MRIVRISVLALVMMSASISFVLGWGVWGHQHINKGAILCLPKEMGMFFYDHADFVIQESTVPDIRKYTIGDKMEPNRHYINLERYNYTTPAEMPATMQAAIAKYGKDSVQFYGILPWYIEEMMEKLTKAFKEKKKTEILFIAADLGHYLGDAHMPLHTSVNHDGQLTDQKGIHSFWESQLPEMFGDKYTLYTRDAHYIDDVNKATWEIIAHTYSLADTLLQTERSLKETFPKDKVYTTDATGTVIKNKYGQSTRSKEYATKYHEMLKGMVEKQLRLAVAATADFWYTAWVNAGKPDMNELDTKLVKERNRKYYEEDMAAWKQGKLTGLPVDYEY